MGEKSPPAEATQTVIKGHSQEKNLQKLFGKFLRLTQTLNTEVFT